jgi:hypothetical protein
MVGGGTKVGILAKVLIDSGMFKAEPNVNCESLLQRNLSGDFPYVHCRTD